MGLVKKVVDEFFENNMVRGVNWVMGVELTDKIVNYTLIDSQILETYNSLSLPGAIMLGSYLAANQFDKMYGNN